jgi:hypothetical protein
VEIDGKSYPVSHLWHGQYYQVPIHLVSFRADLDKRSEQRIQGAAKASPHGMVQEFLNRTDRHLWAFVSNGLKLLILRDSASLTRQAYVEFGLEGIFDGEAYADFRLVWMVCHQSRVEGNAQARPETCWLEVWSKHAQTEGRRALDQLRDGTFPTLRRRDEQQFDEYRTKKVILEIYEAMAKAAQSTVSYQTRLSPPPADNSVAHPWPIAAIQAIALRKNPIADLVAAPDEAWATPFGVTPENVALFALIDVLRLNPDPIDPRWIRLAAILVRKPTHH